MINFYNGCPNTRRFSGGMKGASKIILSAEPTPCIKNPPRCRWLKPTVGFIYLMRGFTLIELLVVIAILGIIAGLSIPFFQTLQVSSDLYTYADTISKTLRRAQQQAIIGQHDSSWGVYFNNGQKIFVLFKGDNYNTREQEYDQQSEYPQTFNVSTDFADEIFFSLYSGLPSAAGVVTITSPNNESENISISSSGLIQINE